MEDKKREMSRRNFLKSGAVVAGSMALGGGLFSAFGSFPAAATSSNETPSWPWPYVQLDVEKAKVLGYEGYGKYRCCYGAFDAVMQQLRDKIGYPYTIMPSEIMMWGGTGGAGWATLCGALIGACTAINLVVGPTKKEVDSVVNELLGWYTTFPFPQYEPPLGKALEVEGHLPTSIAGSTLCHASVSVWCKESKYRAESKERSERCGRLTADVAAKTVQLLNDFHNNKFVPVYKNPQSVQECMTCHGKGSTLENTRGKMECIQCHDDVDLNNIGAHIKKEWGLK